MCDNNSCIEAIGYDRDDTLSVYPVSNLKTASWTSAPCVHKSLYQEANFATDAAAALNATSIGSTKRLDATLISGPNDFMAPFTIEIIADVSFNIDGTPKWVLTADGARPPEVAADYISVKPKTVGGPVNNAGIRVGPYPVSSQISRITTQLEQSSQIIDSKTYSLNHTDGTHMMHTIMEGYASKSGCILQDPEVMNDMRRAGIDVYGSYMYTKDEADTGTNSLIDEWRINNGDNVKTSIEKPYLRVFPVETSPLFQSLAPTLEQMRFLPPGMQLKLMMDIQDGAERLDTGIVVSKSSNGTAGGTFTDAKVTLRFSNIIIRFQNLQMFPDIKSSLFSGRVEGSTVLLDVPKPMTKTLPPAPVARWITPDISITTYGLSNQKQYTIDLTTNTTDTIAPVIGIFVVKANSFRYSGLCTTNWDMMSWSENKISKIRCTRSGGSYELSGFMEYLPSADYDQNRANESTLMHNHFGHQLYLPLEKKTYSMAEQQIGPGFYTWRKRGYTSSQLPSRTGVLFNTESGTGVIPEMTQGLQRGTLSIVVDFTESLSSDYTLLAVQYYRAQLTYDVKERQIDSDVQTYSVNAAMSGLTPNI
jgi:hypothetical protein